jgi:hypothetical protein
MSSLSYLSENSIVEIFSSLSIVELSICSLVSKNFHIYTTNSIIWKSLCLTLWKNKSYIQNIDNDDVQSWKYIYYSSIIDSKRSFIKYNELTKSIFNFRFKKDAGDDWLTNCKWHNGKKASEVIFLNNGSMKTLSSQNELDIHDIELIINRDNNNIDLISEPAIWESNINLSNIKLEWSLEWKKTRRKRYSLLNNYLTKLNKLNQIISKSNNYNLISNEEIEKFETTCGDTIIMKVNGIPVPSYVITRSPTSNWGFLLESCWVLYSSFELPQKGKEKLLEDDYLSISVDDQWLEVQEYNKKILQV